MLPNFAGFDSFDKAGNILGSQGLVSSGIRKGSSQYPP